MKTEDVYVNTDFYEKNEKAKKHLLKIIQKESLFIGSRAWNVSSKNSDYDYLIRYQKLKKIFDYIENKYLSLWECKLMFTQSHGDSCDVDKLNEFYSIIITIDEKKYNVISPIDNINWRAWRSSAKQMVKFIGDDIIKEKQNRVDLFESLKSIYRRKYTKELRDEMDQEIGDSIFDDTDIPF